MTVGNSARTPRTVPASIPSTLWACGTTPIEAADSWPPRVTARALIEYSVPGDRVLLMPATLDTQRLVHDLDRATVTDPGLAQPADTDLILATTLPGTPDLRAPMVAEVAASRLRAGGLLVVLARTWRDHDGAFHDPSGDLITQAQNTDLLYLQHLVAAPVQGTEIVPTPPEPRSAGDPADSCVDTGPSQAFGTDIVHVDVLVFLQPHDLTTA
ncbi:hypothetical protein K7711_02610 [Nocardia sp. CA2R105]|uniref:hypothetical protein n=1 Tax=Nocardia coffeae TaxID=2873381 RepID=UPI001CA7329C|nr:hypothetical protein [Nocardia coffeae]MBY8855359.1 hypothetical protein [Nocardia coffeae]